MLVHCTDNSKAHFGGKFEGSMHLDSKHLDCMVRGHSALMCSRNKTDLEWELGTVRVFHARTRT